MELGQIYLLTGGATVIALDANHCPGSAILLFTLQNGKRFLHCGDMRYHPRILKSLFLAQNKSVIEAIYLDTTYCNPKYTFPPQSDSIEQIVNIVQTAWSDPQVLFLVGTYLIGKERILIELSQRFNCKVKVTHEKMKLVKLCRLEESFTTQESRIRAVPLGLLRWNRIEEMKQKYLTDSEFKRIVAFKPTGWSYRKSGKQDLTIRDGVSIYGIPYSEHSNFEELVEFVKKLKPRAVIPTVNCDSEVKIRKQSDYFVRFLDNSQNKSRIDSYLCKNEKENERENNSVVKKNRIQELPRKRKRQKTQANKITAYFSK